jgi:hypothetical protein
MAGYRLLGQFYQSFLDDGTVNAGGKIWTYETDLTTLKTTYSDHDLTIPNTNPVMLTADGRLASDMWGDGLYGAELMDSANVILETQNYIQSGADPGFEIPALIAGAYLTNDGSLLQWDTDVTGLLLPDMTGEAGNILYTDGTIPYWAPPPEVPTPEDPTIVITANSIKITDPDGNIILEQWGNDEATPSNTKVTSKAVIYPIPYSVAPIPQITTTCGYINQANSVQPTVSVTNNSTTGFTVQFSTQTGEGNSDNNIVSPATFGWFAKEKVAS